MRDKFGLVLVSALTATQKIREYADDDWEWYVLPSDIMGRNDFFLAIREIFPLDPAIESSRSWDALEDSIFGGLSELKTNHIGIHWPNSALMERLAPQEYNIAKSILHNLVTQLDDLQDIEPKSVLILIETL